MNKIIIYQLFVRLFGNKKTDNVFSGSIQENGTGKMNDITEKALLELRKMGISHIWLTGIIEHATTTAYPNILPDPSDIVKGQAGSPYAIRDYYDISPDLAASVENRMREFENLVARIHQADMKVWIDFVPNHISRNYHSDNAPENVTDFGKHDDLSLAFSPNNNYYYLPGKTLCFPGFLQKCMKIELQHHSEGRNNFLRPSTCSGLLCSARNRRQTECNRACSNCRSAKEEDIVNDGKQNTSFDYLPSFREFPAKATGNDCFNETPVVTDWYDTVKLNFGVDYLNEKKQHFSPMPDTWSKMVNILLFWCGKGVDGFRCDMAEMVPVEFWQYAIQQVKANFPETTFVAEIYNESLYRDYVLKGGFDYLYDKVGFYDTVRNIITSDASTQTITDCWKRLQGLDGYMLRFLENHDEQRIASRFFAKNPWKAIPAMMLAATMNTNPVMLYFGQEVGENAGGATGFSGDDGKTSIFDYCHVPQHQRWMNNGAFDGGLLSENDKALRATYSEILQLCCSKESIKTGAFYDLMWANPRITRQYFYLRHNENEKLLFCLNFDAQAIEVDVIIPQDAWETINIKSDCAFKSIFGAFCEITVNKDIAETFGVKIGLKGYQVAVYEMK